MAASGPEVRVPRGRRRSVRWLIAALGVGAGVLLVWLAEGPPALLGRGSDAPDFELPRLAGGAPASLSGLRGRVVLLNFWATWCKPCEDEMPAMERLYRELHPEGFELLAISVDAEQDEVEEFRERLDISFPIALDPAQKSARLYQTMGFPESVLIDGQGRIVERYVGPGDWDHAAYAQRIRVLLQEHNPLPRGP
ncbi:MAG: TlpA disulfide reductase family protein [Myxococcota bacterium]